jgi:hypothetical protein
LVDYFSDSMVYSWLFHKYLTVCPARKYEEIVLFRGMRVAPFLRFIEITINRAPFL